MEVQPTSEVTGLLQAWSGGDERALQKLTDLVYQDLHRAAHRYMRGERTPHTLQTTALIHEVYIRLVGVQQISWQGLTHFLAVCARLTRRVLIDFARERAYQKAGGGAAQLSLDEALTVSSIPDPGLLALDDALQSLAAVDPRKAQVVELRFFGGLTVEETAAALAVSGETVMRDWRLAKSWLLREISRGERDGS